MSYRSALTVAAALLVVACSSGDVSESQINAAIERCVAKQTAKQPTTKGMPDDMAQKFLAAHAKMQRDMCDKIIRETCRQSAQQCSKVVAG